MTQTTLRKILASLLLMLGLSVTARAELEVGQPAPGFRLQDQNGSWQTLEQYRGRWVTLYFYPKDDTPGCTTQACAFRDNIYAFEDLGVVILGVSLDDVESHADFAAKYSLPFPLLSDADGSTAKAYGVLSNIAGFRMASRQTFIIDPQGLITRHYDKVKPATHTDEVLAELRQLLSARQPAGG